MADVVVRAGFAVGEKIEPTADDLKMLGIEPGSLRHRYLTALLRTAFHKGQGEVSALQAQGLANIHMSKPS